MPATTNAHEAAVLLRTPTRDRKRCSIILTSTLDRARTELVKRERTRDGNPAHTARVADECLVLLDMDRLVSEAKEGAKTWTAFAWLCKDKEVDESL